MITANSHIKCEIYDKLENQILSWERDEIYKGIHHCFDIDLHFSG